MLNLLDYCGCILGCIDLVHGYLVLCQCWSGMRRSKKEKFIPDGQKSKPNKTIFLKLWNHAWLVNWPNLSYWIFFLTYETILIDHKCPQQFFSKCRKLDRVILVITRKTYIWNVKKQTFESKFAWVMKKLAWLVKRSSLEIWTVFFRHMTLLWLTQSAH